MGESGTNSLAFDINKVDVKLISSSRAVESDEQFHLLLHVANCSKHPIIIASTGWLISKETSKVFYEELKNKVLEPGCKYILKAKASSADFYKDENQITVNAIFGIEEGGKSYFKTAKTDIEIKSCVDSILTGGLIGLAASVPVLVAKEAIDYCFTQFSAKLEAVAKSSTSPEMYKLLTKLSWAEKFSGGAAIVACAIIFLFVLKAISTKKHYNGLYGFVMVASIILGLALIPKLVTFMTNML